MDSPSSRHGSDSAPAAFSGTFETGKPYQVHHSYVWLSPLATTFAVTFAVLAGFLKSIGQWYQAVKDLGYSGAGLVALCVLAALVVVYAIFVVVHTFAYRNLSFVFDEKEFSLYSGIITKKHVHVPYARVQSVNHRASIVQRIFGLCTVAIDTAGGAANKAVRVPYVTLDVGERIRADLFMRKAAAMAGEHAGVAYRSVDRTMAAAGMPAWKRAGMAEAPNALDGATGEVEAWRGAFASGLADLEPASCDFGLSNKELMLTSISHGSTAVLTAGAAATGLMGMIAAQLGVGFLVLILVLGWLFGLARVVLSFGGFHARRRGNRVEVERGLLQREFSGIDVDRVQSVVIRQSFIRRCLGYCEVSLGRVDVAEDEKSKNSGAKLNRHGLVVHPFVKADKVEGLLADLLPEFADMPQDRSELTALPPVALRRGIVRLCVWRNGALWLAVALAAMQWAGGAAGAEAASAAGGSSAHEVFALMQQGIVIIYVFCALATALMAVSAVLWQRGSGFALAREYVAMRNDGLGTELAIIPRHKVQSGFTRDNPFQRRARVTTITVRTAAGVQGTSTRLRDVRESDGGAWLAWLAPRAEKRVVYAAAAACEEGGQQRKG